MNGLSVSVRRCVPRRSSEIRKEGGNRARVLDVEDAAISVPPHPLAGRQSPFRVMLELLARCWSEHVVGISSRLFVVNGVYRKYTFRCLLDGRQSNLNFQIVDQDRISQ